MITCFPDPHPDEIFYSLCARYANRMKYSAKTAVTRDLFGSNAPLVNIAFPSRLGTLVANLPFFQHYTVDRLIDDHTLFPVFRPFLSSARLSDIRENMVGTNYSSVYTRVSTSIPLPNTEHLRFCPLCVEDDRIRWKECYWHRVHQIPGVKVCPIHRVFLQRTCNITRKGWHEYGFFSAESVVEQTSPMEVDCSDFCQSALLKVALDFAWLLNQHDLSCNPTFLRERYEMILTDRGFANRTSHEKFDIHRLMQEFKKYYPAHLLSMLSCELTEHERNNWLHRLLYGNNHQIHPLHHLLLIHFLGYNVETFNHLSGRRNPFGNGPWPCLNPVSQHYRQRVINDCSISKTTLRGNRRPKGVFWCECGFVYSRIGPDTCEEDSFKIKYILQVGPVWEEALRRLWDDPTISLREMAKRLGLGRPALQCQATRLGLSFPRPGGLLLQPSLKKQIHLNGGLFNDQTRDHYRGSWLRAIQENPGIRVKALQKKYRQVYRWLYTHDRHWQKEHLPPRPQVRRTPVHFINWDERDRQTAKAVEEIVLQIKDPNNAPERITKISIFKRMEDGESLLRYLYGGKLPLTEKMLNNVIESAEEFMIRRIWWMRDRYLREKLALPMRSIFARQTGAENYKPSSKIREAFETAFQSLEAASTQK